MILIDTLGLILGIPTTIYLIYENIRLLRGQAN